jgi:hypothetical protein
MEGRKKTLQVHFSGQSLFVSYLQLIFYLILFYLLGEGQSTLVRVVIYIGVGVPHDLDLGPKGNGAVGKKGGDSAPFVIAQECSVLKRKNSVQ